MNLSMKDRVAVVTGGSKGNGIAVARRFAESGAKVAILARGAADLAAAREALAKDGLEVREYVCDVAKAADISRAHDQIVADLGKVDVLVNNAGTARTLAFENISDEAWQEDLDLKLFAAIRFSRLVWPGMKQRTRRDHPRPFVHQSMILFAAGRSGALKRFLEGGVGQDQRFWRLAQALSALSR